VRLTIPRLLDRRAWTTSSLEAPVQPETFWRARRSKAFQPTLHLHPLCTPVHERVVFVTALVRIVCLGDRFRFLRRAHPCVRRPRPRSACSIRRLLLLFQPLRRRRIAPLPSANSETSGAHSHRRGVSAADGLVACMPLNTDDARVAGDACPQHGGKCARAPYLPRAKLEKLRSHL
jgi:hypothetical protein